MAGFDNAFAKEARDSAWATRQESDLTRALSRIQGAKLDKIECKTTVCRLDFSIASPLRMQTFDQDLKSVLDSIQPRQTSGEGFRGDEVKLTETVYLCKAGYAPPASDGTPIPQTSEAPAP